VVHAGTLVDATLIPSASIRHDDEARWAGHRRRKPVHVYKAHVATDQEAGVICDHHRPTSMMLLNSKPCILMHRVTFTATAPSQAAGSKQPSVHAVAPRKSYTPASGRPAGIGPAGSA
jgi:hypothetical protein